MNCKIYIDNIVQGNENPTNHRLICQYFLLEESDPNSCDAIPTKEGCLDEKIKNVFVMPYDTKSSLYEQFKFFFEDMHVDQSFPDLEKCPSSSLFYEVLADALEFGIPLNQEDFEGSGLTRYIKMLGCRGSFPTCEICNKINEMLRFENVDLCFTLFL